MVGVSPKGFWNLFESWIFGRLASAKKHARRPPQPRDNGGYLSNILRTISFRLEEKVELAEFGSFEDVSNLSSGTREITLAHTIRAVCRWKDLKRVKYPAFKTQHRARTSQTFPSSPSARIPLLILTLAVSS